jgi:hypothetical protein
MSRYLAAVLGTLLVLLLPVSVATAEITQTEDLTLQTENTPRLRLEQTNVFFPAQTWDVAGNEANFFVRDLTGGSRLPFRIRPGAPTSSVDIAANGDVGFGTATPLAPIEISRSGAARMLYTDATNPTHVSWATGIPAGGGAFTIGPEGTEPVLELQSFGDLDLAGSLAEAANEGNVADAQSIDSASILAKVASLPIQSWRFSGAAAGDRHLGPLAGSFSSTFGLGEASGLISPADVAGVSLAAIQALDARNQALTEQNRALSSRVDSIERSSQGLSDRNGSLEGQVGELAPLQKRVRTLAKQMRVLRKAVRKLAN